MIHSWGSGVSTNSSGPFTNTSVSFPAGQTSQTVYAQFNFAAGSGTVTPTPESLSGSNHKPTLSGVPTYSTSTHVLTINFDESMNPQSLTMNNVSSNLHLSFGSGPVVGLPTQVSWSHNNGTVTLTGIGPVDSVSLYPMVSAYGETALRLGSGVQSIP